MNDVKNIHSIIEEGKEYLQYLMKWRDNLEEIEITSIIENAGGPGNVIIVSVDMIEGFCRIGSLASERIEAIINPVVELLKTAYDSGVRNFALMQDSHPEGSLEFRSFPPHCITGTKESQTIKEIMELSFFNEMKVFPKMTIASGIDTGLEEWVAEKNPVKIIVAGDCMDLCTYQLAMFLHLLSVSRDLKLEVIVSDECAATYDLPVKIAQDIGAEPHPGDFFHLVFLHHMHINGIKVVKNIK